MLKPSELLKKTLGLLNTPGNIITATPPRGLSRTLAADSIAVAAPILRDELVAVAVEIHRHPDGRRGARDVAEEAVHLPERIERCACHGLLLSVGVPFGFHYCSSGLVVKPS